MNCIKCEFCNKEFVSIGKFSAHIKKVEKNLFENKIEMVKYICYKTYGEHITEKIIKNYIDEMLCAYDVSKEYYNILELIALMGKKRTHKQEKQTKRYKEKHLKSIQNKYGEHITNISQVPEVRNRINETLADNYGSLENYYQYTVSWMNEGYEIFCSDIDKIKKRQEKLQNTLMKKYGVTNIAQISEVRKKNSKSKIERIKKLSEDERRLMTEPARKAIKFESSLEKKVKKSLIELDLDFIQHIFLWGYNYDVMLRDKILIEVNGDFWHANPKKYIGSDILLGDLTAEKVWHKDKKKFDIAYKNGYDVITLWEDEIKSLNEMSLVNLIVERINDVNNSRR